MKRSGLLTDLYELTMAQGYLLHNRNPQVVFDMFFRRQPFGGGYSIFAGLNDLIDDLEQLSFSSEDIAYLESTGLFHTKFLDYLSTFQFTGDLYAMQEGTTVFPGEPLLRVHSSLIEAQLIESRLLNQINFQTLIATKTARVYLASGRGKIMEFGLRRAQGPDGAMSASRAAHIGGAGATSNTLAGKEFGIPTSGTMAHSWVMAFDSERDAFERYAELYPEKSILLIDTYDTLRSGINNAIEVGLELKKKGRSFGVRLDSGDIQYLSRRVRERLDEAGLEDAVIAVSNELDETIIAQLVAHGAPVDLWGVGTSLVTGGSDSSLTGVYKLAAKATATGFEPTMKVSDNPSKTTNPGIKQVHRFYARDNTPIADLVSFDDESWSPGEPVSFFHPDTDYRCFRLHEWIRAVPLLKPHMKDGKRIGAPEQLSELRARALSGLEEFDDSFKRLINPHIYRVSITEIMKQTKLKIVTRFLDSRPIDE
ncbi:MAG: nicotinate phosphoribosyltransferase [Spirochaetaceae bacterium]|nr:MAG: nicotinate phosphoribosyltransferase [Spirochaetaceae bacterium]